MLVLVLNDTLKNLEIITFMWHFSSGKLLIDWFSLESIVAISQNILSQIGSRNRTLRYCLWPSFMCMTTVHVCDSLTVVHVYACMAV